MKKSIVFIVLTSVIFSCTPKPAVEQEIVQKTPLEGTWELISALTITGDSTAVSDLRNKRMIKIINATHFAFLNHDLQNGKDSTAAAYTAGGGTYSLVGNKYTENLEYLNYREWEGKTFEFDVEIKGDTLIQNGLEKIEELGVDRKIIETYVRTVK